MDSYRYRESTGNLLGFYREFPVLKAPHRGRAGPPAGRGGFFFTTQSPS